MLFMFLYSITIFCSDYIFIYPINDTEISFYVSLNNLDNELQLSLLIHELSILDTLKSCVNRYIGEWFEVGINNPPHYFKPVDISVYQEIEDLLQSVQFNTMEELVTAESFFRNEYILKTTFTPRKFKSYYIERLQVKKGNPEFIFKKSEEKVENDTKLYEKVQFFDEDFYHTEDKTPLKFKTTKEAEKIEKIYDDYCKKGLKLGINRDNIPKTINTLLVEDVKKQNELKKPDEKVLQGYTPNSKINIDNYIFQPNNKDGLNAKVTEQDINSNLDNENKLHNNKNEYLNKV
ncbi:putative SP-containing protein [Vairimorpha necatrix]|uniref:SP-containing protein n=1 Tax=Vairimorpha necatrix TaxID=6039 RepID=A0AAX4J982_9MICR